MNNFLRWIGGGQTAWGVGGSATGRLGWAAKERRGVQSRGGRGRAAAIGVGTGQGGPAGSLLYDESFNIQTFV
jgi:hypothetical protein